MGGLKMPTVKGLRITQAELDALHEAAEDDERLLSLLDRLCDDPACGDHGDDEVEDD